MLSLAVVSCTEKEIAEARAVATDVEFLTFEGQNAAEQVVLVASDGDWLADVSEDWITVDPMSGRGAVEVKVTVTDNIADGALAAPRKGTIVFRGSSIERQGEVTVHQKGDTYLGVVESTVTEVAELEDEQVAKIKGSQVVAAAKDGFVITDGTTYMYVKSSITVNVGDKLFLNGEKTTLNGIPSFIGDEVQVLESGSATHPKAVDLTSQVDSYAGTSIGFVTIEGTLVGTAVKNIPGVPAKSVSILAAPTSLGLDAVAVHKVALTGYHIGMNGGAHQIVVVSFEDNGIDDSIGVDFPFKDDFSWLDSYIAAANGVLAANKQISDSVGDVLTSADGAANIYTTLANNGCMVLEELRARGYTDLNPSLATIYLQDAYFKFGATDKQSGLTLPLMKMEGTQDIAVQFKWCCHLSGALNVDKVNLVVSIEGPGTVVREDGASDAKVSDPIKSKQEKGQMFWQDVTVKINGATSGTFITICPESILGGKESESGVHRYYLDDISVMPAADLVPAVMEVSGAENNIITFEGTPEAPATFSVLSDREFTVASNVNWLSFNVETGPANELTEIEVTCEPSELSELRRGVISVKSGTSVHEIQVIQSAAGVALSPFISLIGGNSTSVNFDQGSFTLGVQSNVEYSYSVDAAWVSVEPVPATKAMVEMSELAVTYEANTLPEQRVAHIRVFNEDENVESVYTLTQAAYETGVYFQEDFSWVSPWADAYGSGDSVGDNNASGAAPNVYTQGSHLEFDGVGYDPNTKTGNGVAGYPSFLTEFTNRGYVDVNAAKQALYTQKYYLKLGKGSCHTGIKLPAMEFEGATATDAVLSFDWSAQMTGSGNIDKLKIVVEIEGDGVCADSYAKISNPISPNQTKGQLKWQPIKVYLSGVTSNTRIIIRPTILDDSDGITQKRWYIDNIKVAKPKFETVAAWHFSAETMSAYADNFGTTAGTADKTAGDGGMYVNANLSGSGKITYVQIDKTEIDTKGKAVRITGGTGHPYITGGWPGDYWYFEAQADQTYPAGTVANISYLTRASGTGMKYWRMEYLDGETWKPVVPTTSETLSDGQTFDYNIVMPTSNVELNYTVALTASTTGLKFRMVTAANAQANGSGALAAPNGGTHRIAADEVNLGPTISVLK